MPRTMLFDTDVLIDYLRGQGEAVEFLERQQGELKLSALTVAELYAGVREGQERQILDGFIQVFGIVSVTDAIARDGGLLRRDYGKSHGLGLADAVIAATAIAENAILVTLNRKHFPMLTDILVPYSRKHRSSRMKDEL